MMKKILYGSIFCIWYLMSLLPLRVLYILSDGLFYLIYYVVKYRRPLVRKHLFDSFPEKSEAERIKIEKEFYSWFCDYIVETIKLFTMSKKQVMKRMQFIGAEKVRRQTYSYWLHRRPSAIMGEHSLLDRLSPPRHSSLYGYRKDCPQNGSCRLLP